MAVRGIEVSLKVEGEDGLKFSCFLEPWPELHRCTESAEIASGKTVNVIYIRIAAQQRCELPT